MAKAVSFKVEGLADLDRALGELTKATARNTLYRVLTRAAAPMDAAWRQDAPIRLGRLKRSGGIQKTALADFNKAYSTTLRGGGDKASAVAAGRAAQRENASGRAFAEIVVGPGPNPQAIQQEFGNSHNAAQPFARPAWDDTKDRALDIVKSELGGEIDKAAKRLAKKAAKLSGG
jgi:HK97 gp10 family phage protein